MVNQLQGRCVIGIKMPELKDNTVKVDFYDQQYWKCDPHDVLRPKKVKRLWDRNAQDEDQPCHCRKKPPAKPSSEDSAANPQLDNTVPKSAKKTYRCGKDSIKLVCKKCGNEHFLVYRCGSRICRDCAKSRQNELFARLKDFVKNFRLPYGMRYRFITLTMKRRTFDEDIPKAFKSLQKLWHNLLEPNGVGAITHLELAPHGMVHWHMIYIGRYIKKSHLKDAWFKATKTSYITDIKEIKTRHINNSLLELAKYITKFSETPRKMLFAFYKRVKNNRLLRTFGVFFAYKWGVNSQLLCECGNDDWKYDGIKQSFLFNDDWLFDEPGGPA